MARRLIGLDVGTNAVTIAEVTPGTPPRLDMFAQVALARSAMREGEVADEGAVTDAVARLRSEVGLKKIPVRVGIASPRVVVRQVEMPVMTRDELASALQFQAGDLIPIPIEDAVLDFAILGTSTGGEGGEPTMQVLLAAAYEATVMRLVSAVEAGGLAVAAVDLVPLALTRALAHPAPALVAVGADGMPSGDEHVGAEGIVSFGGGVTSIAVHENGTPRFVRVIGSGGRELTDAIATDLEVPAETAEALKRQIGLPTNDELVGRARTSIDRPLSVLLDEVRSSIDYYRNQGNAARLLRVVATGGTAQLPGLPERLAALVGVPVEHASMHDLIRVGDIGFAPDELPRLEPYLPAAVGLALGGAGVGTVIDLLPRTRKGAKGTRIARPQFDRKIVVGAAVAIAALLGVTYLAHSGVSDAKKQQAAAEAQVQKLQNLKAQMIPTAGGGNPMATLQMETQALLGTDVEWLGLVDHFGSDLPGGVWLTTFQAQRAIVAPSLAGAGTTGSPGTAGSSGGPANYAGAIATAHNGASNLSNQQNGLAANAGSNNPGGSATAKPGVKGAPAVNSSSAGCAPLSGTITFGGVAVSLPAISQYLDNLAKDNNVSDAWVISAQAAKFGTADVIVFTASANLADGAHSSRIGQFFKGASCR
jgi:type IV pilus assembly protein PilM